MTSIPNPVCLNWVTEIADNVKLGISKAKSTVTLFYKKNGTVVFKTPSDQFNVILKVYNSPMSATTFQHSLPSSFEAQFIRKTKSNGKNVVFYITDLGVFTDGGASLKQLVSSGINEKYDFSFPDNMAVFEQIQSCVKAKLLEVYKNLNGLLVNCRNLSSSNETKKIKCSPSPAPTPTPISAPMSTPTPAPISAPMSMSTPLSPQPPTTNASELEKFLDSMFIIPQNILTNPSELQKTTTNIQQNVNRLLTLSQAIIRYLSEQTISPHLAPALSEFISVYSRIIYDTTTNADNNEFYVQPFNVRPN
jgi:hypothetical protein